MKQSRKHGATEYGHWIYVGWRAYKQNMAVTTVRQKNMSGTRRKKKKTEELKKGFL